MNKLDRQYTDLLQDILDNGVEKKDRTGTGTISVFGRQIRHKMSDGFPLLTTKKMYMKGIITELLWFLRGDTNIKYLVDNNCHIWDGDAYKNYEKEWLKENPAFGGPYTDPCLTQEEFIDKIKTDDEFAKKWGDLGPIYGKQWKSWGTGENVTIGHNGLHTLVGERVIDQIANLINDLKRNPDSRRLMVNAWNVGELDQMVLPPCHYGFQVYTRELTWYNDLDKIKEIYVNWSLSKCSGGYAGDIKGDTIESANQIFVDGWENNKDPFTGKPLIGLECFTSIPKRAISLMWNQRSVDTFLGLPFNIASYGLLLEIIAKEVNMVPDELIGNLGDTHLYLNHIEQAKEQIGRELSLDERIDLASADIHFDPFDFGVGVISAEHSHKVCDDYGIPSRTREPYPLPKLVHYKTDAFYKSLSESVSLFEHLKAEDFKIEDYQSHPTIKAPLSN
jgi:thymidylate synthase